MELIDGESTAFDRRNVLRNIERVGSQIPERPYALAAPLGTDGVRSVLDHRNASSVAETVEPVHVYWASGEMDGHDSARSRSDRSLHGVKVEKIRAGLRVD